MVSAVGRQLPPCVEEGVSALLVMMNFGDDVLMAMPTGCAVRSSARALTVRPHRWPTLFWPSPVDGTTISGRSYNVAVTSSDDHAVKKIDLYLDGAYASTTSCDDITYICQLNYSWSPRTGQHTATFKSYDWMGNVGALTVSFTVS